MSQNFETVGYLHIKNKKVLLAKSKKYNVFYVPGGKKNLDEDNVDAIIREVEEELSVAISKDSVRFYGAFSAQAHAKEKGIKVKILYYSGVHTGEIKPDHEIEELRYVSYDEFFEMEETAPAVRLIVRDLKKKGLID